MSNQSQKHLDLKEEAIAQLKEMGFTDDEIHDEYSITRAIPDVVGIKPNGKRVAFEVGTLSREDKLEKLGRVFDEVHLLPYPGYKPITKGMKRMKSEIELSKSIYDNSHPKKTITIKHVKSSTSDRRHVHVLIEDQNEQREIFRLRSKKVFDFIDIFQSFFYNKRTTEIPYDITFSYETVVLMVLLQSKNYSFTKNDLIKLGMKRRAVEDLLRRMIKKKMVLLVGKIGKENLYSGTLPKKEFQKLFGYGRDNDKEEVE